MRIAGRTYAHCRGWKDCPAVPPPVECPSQLRYPPPPLPTHILFVGWNPPGSHHVWEGVQDDLRDNISWIFQELGWRGDEHDFRKELLRRGCYFVHAVKCWRTPEWPTADAAQRCSPLLAEDIKNINPKNLCILGKWAHVGAALILSLPAPSPSFRYGKGWNGDVDGMNVIITTFANRRWNRAQNKENRACVAEALRRWVRVEAHGPLSSGPSQ